MKTPRLLTTLFAMLFLTSTFTLAQTAVSVDQSASFVKVTGTSSLHDWESNVEEFEGTATVKVEDSKLASISDVNLKMSVKSMKSGKGAMDKKTHGALEVKKHPFVTFALGNIIEITADSIFATGSITVAGKTIEEQLTVAYKLLEDGSILVSGEKPLAMSQFEIKPPTALLGTLKTGDDIVVHFEIKLSNQVNQ